MDSISSNQKNAEKCTACQNGKLKNKVYYVFCDLIGLQFCNCPKGRESFRLWCKAPEVQRGYRRKQEAKIKKALKVSQLPTRWQGQNISDVKNEIVRSKLENYLANFAHHKKRGIGIYFRGESDIERARLLTILCLEIIGRYSQPCIFLHENQIFSKIQSSYKSVESDSSRFIHELQSVSCLFIDSFAGKIKSWHCEQLHNIVNSRFNNSLPTFFSSFYPMEEYQKIIENTLPEEQQSLPPLVAKMCCGFEINIKSQH